MALMWDGCLGLVGASSDDLLRTTTMQKYLDHMDNIGLKEGVHWWWENRKTVIKFKNGSAIRFRTLSDWTQLMSTEFTWIEFEEASFLPEIVFKKLITRLREAKKSRWKNYYRSLFMHTNPQGKRGWLYKYFRNPKTRIDGYRCIIASTRENHHLGDTYVSMLEDLYSEDEINEMIEGLDVETDDSTMFPSFDIDKNVVDGLAYDPSLKLILTCDFNVNPMCWYLAQETNDGIWHVIREFIGYDVTTRSMIETVSPIIESYGTKELIICGDAAGKARKTNGSPDYAVIISYLSSQGFDCTLQVQSQNPDVVRRLTVLKRYIKNAKGVRRLLVDSSCEKLIYNFNECTKNLTTGKIKEPTDAEIRDDKEKIHIGHPIDAVSYPIWMRDALRDAQGVNSD